MKRPKVYSTHNEAALEDIINKTLAKMTRRDKQVACVKRGLEFHLVVAYDNHQLSNWFYKNYEKGEDETLVPEYDAYMESELEKRGYKKGDPVLAPCFRLGYNPLAEMRAQITSTPEKQKELPNIRPKREKDEQNIVAGTKKSLTYKLTKQGLSKQEVIDQVLKQFKDAQPKSITIWMARAKKEMK